MRASEHINEIATALAKAQGAILNPARESENPHFRSRYADLASGLNAIKTALSMNGICFTQATYMADSVMMLETRLTHTSGQWIAADYPVCAFPAKHQEAGSALTYARRYSLFSMVGIAGDDDDGNDGSKSETPAPKTHRIPSPPTSEDPQESSTIMMRVLGELNECKSDADLDAWVIRNESKSKRMIGAHISRVRDSVRLTEKRIREEAIAE